MALQEAYLTCLNFKIMSLSSIDETLRCLGIKKEGTSFLPVPSTQNSMIFGKSQD